MPEIIAFHFRQAITARTHLSKAFRQASKGKDDSAATENHDLTKIYVDLCECCAKPKDDCSHRFCEDHCTTQDGVCSNRFNLLDYACDAHESTIISDVASSSHDASSPMVTYYDSLPDQAPCILVDDGLSNAFEVYQQEIHETFREVYTIWQKAAQDASHIVSATVATNAACTQLESVEHRLVNVCDISDPADLLKSYGRLQDHVNQASPVDRDAQLPEVDTVNDMHDCWQAMRELRSAATKDDYGEKILNPRLPSKISLRQGLDASIQDSQCRDVLLSNIAQCISTSRLQNPFVRAGSPVIPEVGFFMSREKTPTNCLHCSSGLSLLMTSYKAYCFALTPEQSPSRCRVQALRLAQDAAAQISLVLDSPTMPCRCHGTLAFHLENLQHDFEEYLRTKMFDLYFQSPWVCGGHVLEMMHALRYYGLRLVTYRSYMGSVMHMYNVLRQLHDFTSIPVLESLCEHLAELFFPGGRPKQKFKNCYVRYLGGRLRFHAKARHQNGCHGLVIPAHAAKATAGLSFDGEAEKDPRFDCGRVSLLYRIKNRGYHVDGATWDAVCHASSKSSPQKSKSSAHSRSGSSTSPGPIANRFQALQRCLDRELGSSSPFPTATFNFFPLYLLCVRVIDRISDAYHDPEVKKGQRCLCCVENLMVAADGCRDGKGWRVRKEVGELVEVCERVLREEMGGKEVGEFVWGT
ncbi:MAG: hypothetical protein Q9219_006259 [cf. Caloplaca sp. 3 TL-2023]